MLIRVKDQLGMNVKNHDGCKPVDQTCERIYLQCDGESVGKRVGSFVGNLVGPI